MSVIVNATPLITLAIINRLTLLHQLFGEVIVPTTVYQEVVYQGGDRPGTTAIAEATWLTVVSPKRQPSLEPLLLGIDAGETEVLLLAQELQPDWVIIDERQARRIAQAMGFAVKGTLGILLAANFAGFVSKQDVLTDLQTIILGGIRISSQLQDWLEQELR